MKIALSIQRNDKNSPIDPRFGRCRYFYIADTSDGTRTIIENSAGTNALQGAGLKAVQIIAEFGATILVTGQVGPKAASALKAAGIRAYAMGSGTAEDALAKFERNELSPLV